MTCKQADSGGAMKASKKPRKLRTKGIQQRSKAKSRPKEKRNRSRGHRRATPDRGTDNKVRPAAKKVKVARRATAHPLATVLHPKVMISPRKPSPIVHPASKGNPSSVPAKTKVKANLNPS